MCSPVGAKQVANRLGQVAEYWMKRLAPLLDHTGNTTAWADPTSGWVSDRMGNVFALVWFAGVFNRTGAQVGWWYGDHIRDRYGRVVLFRPGTKIEGINMPRPKKIPPPPKLHLPSGHPVLKWLPTPSVKKHQWADLRSLHDGLGRLRAWAAKAASSQEKSSGSVRHGKKRSRWLDR